MSVSNSPFYYFKKTFLANRPAFFGVLVILLAIVISLLGYSIMPDDTTNANNSLPEIKKQPPGYTVNILKVAKNIEVADKSFLDRLFNGAESRFIEKPYDSLVFRGNEVRVYLANGRGVLFEDILLTDVLYAVDSDGPIDEINEKSSEEINALTLEELRGLIESHVSVRTYYLGLDSAGRDLLSRLLFGTRVSLTIGLVTVVIAVSLGLFLGGIAGFYGGWIDQVVMWFLTVVWSIPRIMLVIVIGMALQSKGCG